MRANRACEKGYGSGTFNIWKPYNCHDKRVTKRFISGPHVADPAATTSPTLWTGQPGEQQEQREWQGDPLLLEVSLFLKRWHVRVVLATTECHALQNTACLEMDWSTETFLVSAARPAAARGPHTSKHPPQHSTSGCWWTGWLMLGVQGKATTGCPASSHFSGYQ